MSDKQSASVFQIFSIFLLLGLTSFGGPVAHIGYFHQEFVKRRGWLNEAQFSQLLALCQFIPGPASSQLGFAIGLSRGGGLGALAAFIGFTLPSVLALVAFVSLLPLLSEGLGQALVHGLKIVAFVVVADAVLGMASKLCPDPARKTMAIAAVIALLLFASPGSQLMLIVIAAFVGVWLFKNKIEANSNSQALSIHITPIVAKLSGTLFAVLLVATLLSFEQTTSFVLTSLYQAGALVFGGGHVVLPYLEKAFVSSGLLDKETFLAGYGAVQAVPGPLFTFASYLSAVIPTSLSLWLMVTLGTLAVFLPGFLLLLAVLPAWQQVSHNQHAKAALAGVNAVVVGILAAALYNPIFTSSILAVEDLAVALVGFVILSVWKKPPIWVVIWGIIASIGLFLLS